MEYWIAIHIEHMRTKWCLWRRNCGLQIRYHTSRALDEWYFDLVVIVTGRKQQFVFGGNDNGHSA